MIAVIKEYNNKLFELNGIKYVRNFQAIKIGNSVRISNAYDSKFTLVVANYSEFTINGLSYNNSEELVSALSPLLFVKDEVTTIGSSEAGNTTTNAVFHNINGEWINTPADPITGVINFDTTHAVNGGLAAVYFNGSSLIFSGGTVIIQSGEFVPNELILVWIIYDKGSNGFQVSIQSGFTGNIPIPPDDITPPEKMTINLVVDSGEDIYPPNQMTIIRVSGDTIPPEKMTINSVT